MQIKYAWIKDKWTLLRLDTEKSILDPSKFLKNEY